MLETALYVDDMPRARKFYVDFLGLSPMFEDERLTALDAGQGTVLLLFRRGATIHGGELPNGRIPPHDGSGPVHLALAIAAADLTAWEARLTDAGVAIESRLTWDRGGISLYFRDPDGHSVELATPGVWPTY